MFEHMLQETRKEQFVRYLWGFSKREMPRLEPSVLKLAESEDTAIRDAAISALAIKLMESGNLDGLELLQYNWREGDYPVIEALLFTPSDNTILHCATSNLIDIYDANESPETAALLLWVYENTPCSMCREMAVKRLVELNALPVKLKHECRYDCSEHTRTEVKKI